MTRLEKDSAFPMLLPLPAQLCSGVNTTFWWSFGWLHSVPALFTLCLSSLADGSSQIMNLLLSNCIKAMEIGPFVSQLFLPVSRVEVTVGRKRWRSSSLEMGRQSENQSA